MKYRYLYQDSTNTNREGEINARDREDAYRQLRKQGIKPYRVIGDDPWNWRPWVIAAGYAVLLMAVAVLTVMLAARMSDSEQQTAPALAEGEAEDLRNKAAEAVERAPEAFRYTVWSGVNARLKERGIEPLPRPEGLKEE